MGADGDDRARVRRQRKLGNATGGGQGTGGRTERLCEPGSTQTCVGPGQCPGGQSCNAEGTARGACDCGDGGTGGRAGTGGGTGGTTTGGASTDGSSGCSQWGGLGDRVTGSLAATLRTANLLILLDKSGSMTKVPATYGGTTKLDATKSALGEVLNASSLAFNFGLDLFPKVDLVTPCAGQPCCAMPNPGDPLTVPVGPAATSVPAIMNALASTSPGGGTPTAAALARALDYYTTGAGRSLTGDKYVLLLTDGGPNCNTALACEMDKCTRNLDPDLNCSVWQTDNCCSTAALSINCLDDQSVLTEIASLRNAGIATIVVGIPGSDPYASYLNAFAVAGGEPNPDPGSSTSYYRVAEDTGTSGVASTLGMVIRNLAGVCQTRVPTLPPDLSLLNVAVNCQAIGQLNGGWSLDAGTQIVTLTGAACDRLTAGTVARVDYVYGCPTLR